MALCIGVLIPAGQASRFARFVNPTTVLLGQVRRQSGYHPHLPTGTDGEAVRRGREREKEEEEEEEDGRAGYTVKFGTKHQRLRAGSGGWRGCCSTVG